MELYDGFNTIVYDKIYDHNFSYHAPHIVCDVYDIKCIIIKEDRCKHFLRRLLGLTKMA